MRKWLIEKLGGYTNIDQLVDAMSSDDVTDDQRDAVIVALGGFPTVEDAIAYIRDMDDVEAKHSVLQLAVQHLFRAINPDEVLKITPKGEATFLGRMLSKEQVEGLIQDANSLKEMKLWAVLRWDMRYHISRKMFEEGKVPNDFVWGQLATWLWDVLRTRIDKLAEMGKTLK